MSEVKKFKSALDSPVTLEVERETQPAGVYLSIEQSTTILLASSGVPALALAEMEAAGYTKDDRDDSGFTHFAIAMLNLRMGIENQERATAEAEAQPELEAEALELVNAHRKATGLPAVTTWEGFSHGTKDTWLAVARRARELAKEATK